MSYMFPPDDTPSVYGWIIDQDHLASPEDRPGTNMNAVGVMGPYDATDEITTALQAGKGRKFRMYDDDGELYYSGRIISPEVGQGADIGEEGFAPLWDYGTPNAGATEIRYHVDGRWTEL